MDKETVFGWRRLDSIRKHKEIVLTGKIGYSYNKTEATKSQISNSKRQLKKYGINIPTA